MKHVTKPRSHKGKASDFDYIKIVKLSYTGSSLAGLSKSGSYTSL